MVRDPGPPILDVFGPLKTPAKHIKQLKTTIQKNMHARKKGMAHASMYISDTAL